MILRRKTELYSREKNRVRSLLDRETNKYQISKLNNTKWILQNKERTK